MHTGKKIIEQIHKIMAEAGVIRLFCVLFEVELRFEFLRFFPAQPEFIQ